MGAPVPIRDDTRRRSCAAWPGSRPMGGSGWAIALGCTVVSAPICSKLCFLIDATRVTAAIVSCSRSYMPSWPIRWRQRTSELGSIGSASWK
jgi:hypothetical protein